MSGAQAYTVSHYGEVEPVTWETSCDLTVQELCSAVCRVLRLSENGPTCHALAAAFERRWGGTYSPLALPTIRAHIAAILALARGPGLDTGRATRLDYALLSWCSASRAGRRYLGYLPRWERSCRAHVPTIRAQVHALQAEIARLEAGIAEVES